MHICLIWTLLVRFILGRFLLPYWDISFVCLNKPDFTKPFFLLTDTSAYDMGAILSQKGGSLNVNRKPKLHPVTYFSATFTETERNYDIYK
jgi:RNase H-like domain found in reverse transcriptase